MTGLGGWTSAYTNTTYLLDTAIARRKMANYFFRPNTYCVIDTQGRELKEVVAAL